MAKTAEAMTRKPRTIRGCTAPYEYNDPKSGELVTKDVAVRYFSFTWNEIEEQQESLAAIVKDNPEAPVWPHRRLSDRIHSFPDGLPDFDGKFDVTPENLGDLDTKNLQAIKKAIDEDFQGK